MVKIGDCKVEPHPSPVGNHGVKVTHIPTGIVRYCNTEHTQSKNLDKALKFIEEEIINKLKEDCLAPKTKIAFAHVMEVAFEEAHKKYGRRGLGNRGLDIYSEADRNLIYKEAFQYMWKLLRMGGSTEHDMVYQIVDTISKLKIEGGKLKI